MILEEIKQKNIPTSPGSYQFLNKENQIIYIGKAANLKNRVFSYWQKSAQLSPAKKRMILETKKIEWIETETEIEAFLLESNLIKKYQPYYNISLRDDKRFAYLKISLDDEIPGVFITRKIDKGGRYFGPFTSVNSLRQVLKILRKLWPYCTERKLQQKPCFSAQIGRCTGVCAGQQEIAEYKEKNIKQIILFLEGKKKKLIKNIESRIKNLENKIFNNKSVELEDELRRLKYGLLNMQKILAHANIISVSDKYANDVVELAKVFHFPRIPERIEGYDISNIYGKYAVGSMVVFSGGEPDKKEYKKFKIKLDEGADDVGMLKEVLERRLRHLPHVQDLESGPLKSGKLWKLPDLIILDGGKGQLNAISKLLKKEKLDIPLLAISKGKGLRSAAAPDKIFFPGKKEALVLPLASPALHIIKRVRDEAHRFAIKYHRELRAKSFK